MSDKRKPTPLQIESDDWDKLSIDQLIELSEPLDAVFIDQRKPKKSISMRVDPDLIIAAKKIASQWGLGYQTLFRVWLLEGMNRYCRRLDVDFRMSEEEGEPVHSKG